MKLGIKLPYNDRNASAEDLKEFVRVAEQKGFNSVWLGDHIVLPETANRSNYPYLWRFTERQLACACMQSLFPDRYFLEAISTCGYIAGITHNMSIGIGVLVVPMRNAVELAAQLATLDVLSGGKVIVGVGAGWMREEFEALGHRDAYEARGQVLDESIQAMRTLWGKQQASFNGTTLSFKSVYCEPTPIEPDGPPIWIGGNSKRALRRAVELGNGWQSLELPPREFAESCAKLDNMLMAVGREPSAVERSVSTRLPLSNPADGRAAEIVEAYLHAGCTHLVMYSGLRNSIEHNLKRALAFHDIASQVIERAGKA